MKTFYFMPLQLVEQGLLRGMEAKQCIGLTHAKKYAAKLSAENNRTTYIVAELRGVYVVAKP